MNVRQSAALYLNCGLAVGIRCLHRIRCNNVCVDGSGIRHITESGIVRIHGRHGAIVFEDGRFANLDIGELDADFDFPIGTLAGIGGLVLETLDGYPNGRAGGAGGGPSGAGEIEVRRPRHSNGTRPQNRL